MSACGVSLMNIRESMEQREQKMLSPYAALSLCSRGRERQEEEWMYGLSIRETGQDPS